MKKKVISLLAIILISFGLISCDKNKDNITSHSFNAMGTIIQVQLYEKADGAFEEVEDIFSLYSQLTSGFKENEVLKDSKYYGLTNVYLINKNAGIEPLVVKKELIDVLELGLQLHESTNGYFNIALGHIADDWKFFISGQINHSKSKYDETVEKVKTYEEVDLNKLVIDKENSTVFLKDDSLQLDLGAIAKGYATQVAYDYLKNERGIKRFKINSGNSSIAIGLGPKNHQMKTYISDEHGIYEEYAEGISVLGYIKGENYHIATSGSGQQYVDVKDENNNFYTKAHHLMSPFTLEPINNYYKVSVVGNDSGLLDVFSTAAFLMDLEDAIAFLTENNVGYVFYLKDYSVLTNLDEDVFVQYKIIKEIN